MVDITLSAEQIRQAPPEVRRWIGQLITGALGLEPEAGAAPVAPRHLLACGATQARAVLEMIQGIPAVVGVFFELAREPAVTSTEGVRVLRLDDMVRHAHLQAASQIGACLQLINEALQRVSGKPDATLTVLDDAGHCLVAEITAQSILTLWHEIVAAQGLAAADPAAAPQQDPTPPPVTPIAPAPFGQMPYVMSAPRFTATKPPGVG